MTASAHPLVLRPVVQLLRAQGHEVEITTRDYGQTNQIVERLGMSAEVIGHHGGASAFGKARQMTSRLGALKRWAKPRRFDLAIAHGSHEPLHRAVEQRAQDIFFAAKRSIERAPRDFRGL